MRIMKKPKHLPQQTMEMRAFQMGKVALVRQALLLKLEWPAKPRINQALKYKLNMEMVTVVAQEAVATGAGQVEEEDLPL